MKTRSTAKRQKQSLPVKAILLSNEPAVYLTALPGRWLLEHSTPSWRIKDPLKGFQRIVKEQRAKEIARTVLEAHRAFPNAITLATTTASFPQDKESLLIPGNAKFLVVDGQHRLWAQKFSQIEGNYPCVIHMDRTERDMAALFLEINDNQRRVPSSLRWDLVRLVRDGDESSLMASDLVYELAIRKESPFYFALDLTGERNELSIKQGSLAPEIKMLVSRHLKKSSAGFEEFLDLLIRFFVAVRSLDPEGWGNTRSPFYKARVMRALIRLLSDMADQTPINRLTTVGMRKQLARIDPTTLSETEIKRAQGAVGVRYLYLEMHGQVFANA